MHINVSFQMDNLEFNYYELKAKTLPVKNKSGLILQPKGNEDIE